MRVCKCRSRILCIKLLELVANFKEVIKKNENERQFSDFDY